jgi:hypothetical protein
MTHSRFNDLSPNGWKDRFDALDAVCFDGFEESSEIGREKQKALYGRIFELTMSDGRKYLVEPTEIDDSVGAGKPLGILTSNELGSLAVVEHDSKPQNRKERRKVLRSERLKSRAAGRTRL